MNIFSTPTLRESRLQAVQALIVYKDEFDSEGEPTHAFTAHPVTATARGDRIGPGRLLGAQDLQLLLDALLGSSACESGFLPADVICHSSTQIAWYVPGRVRPMWFRMNKQHLRLNVPWPTLLFRVKHGRLSLAALTHESRPSAETDLYHAPLMNVHQNTILCPGTAHLPQSWSLSQRSGYESAVFETNFTQTNHTRTLALGKKVGISDAQHLRFWRDLDTRAAKCFPTNVLVPLQKTVSDWLTCC